MRETTSSSGAASSSGSLKGCTPSATPATSSNNRCSSAFGTVGTKETPSTSSGASTSAQPALDIVVGSSSFFLLIPDVLVAIGRSLLCCYVETLSRCRPPFHLARARLVAAISASQGEFAMPTEFVMLPPQTEKTREWGARLADALPE